eukprot:14855903-Alexandrium_andersonii.AAC.1
MQRADRCLSCEVARGVGMLQLERWATGGRGGVPQNPDTPQLRRSEPRNPGRESHGTPEASRSA